MYEWLETEISAIRTRKFHLTRAVLPAGRARIEIDWPSPPPPSYAAFIERFGNALLYRELGYWLIRVYSRPSRYKDQKAQEFLEFGGFDSGIACFRPEDLEPGKEAPVYESRGMSGLFQTAHSFELWLANRAKAAHKHYRRDEWEQILKGPAPFTQEEIAIVDARRKFKWRVVGVAENGNILFEVRNGSNRTLPFLTIGINSPKLHGGIWLPVGSVLPGATKVLDFDVYKDQVDPKTLEAYEEPDPGPEDRDRYWEFGKPR